MQGRALKQVRRNLVNTMTTYAFKITPGLCSGMFSIRFASKKASITWNKMLCSMLSVL